MSFVASLLGGAKSRLLPMSVPFRFFAAATVFHILMWACLLAAAGELTGFRGGPGPSLAALHLLTLGVLTTTAVGASAQLLPVATRRSLVAVWPIKLIFWLLVPGLLVLLAGMYAGAIGVLIAGSIAVVAALALFAVLLADNLRRAQSLPVVAAYGWTALAALMALAALGVLLGVDYTRAVLPDHGSAALAHAILGGYGFMGMLAVGFSYVLVPMFALSRSADTPRALTTLAFALAGLLLGSAGALADNHIALNAAIAAGGIAAAIHLVSMRHILAGGMRKRLGLSFVLVRIAWAMLPVSLLAGLAALHGLAGPNGPTLFGFLLLSGWLLTFLLGILQRIMPFLASMHAMRAQSAPPPLLSELAGAGPLKVHAVCHVIAVSAIAAGIGFNQVLPVRLGAVIGLAGALAFAAFTATIIRRMLTPAR
jgi:hypothetical protein